jgi:hypothetical protein
VQASPSAQARGRSTADAPRADHGKKSQATPIPSLASPTEEDLIAEIESLAHPSQIAAAKVRRALIKNEQMRAWAARRWRHRHQVAARREAKRHKKKLPNSPLVSPELPPHHDRYGHHYAPLTSALPPKDWNLITTDWTNVPNGSLWLDEHDVLWCYNGDWGDWQVSDE